jgi:hypothetical protein
MRIFKTLPPVLAALVATACQDGVSTPASPETSLRPEGPRLTLATSQVTTAVLYPTYDNVYVSSEGHRLVIPANSICKVGVSGYGAGTWDAPCAPQTAPIVFTIKSTIDANGAPRITVTPDVRFSPSKTVSVSFANAAAANALGTLINYCPTGLTTCVDESVTDASLRTYTDKATGRVYRRIKHFSGYNVVFGFDGGSESMLDRAASVDGAGVQEASAERSRSGYITTTGRALGSTH